MVLLCLSFEQIRNVPHYLCNSVENSVLRIFAALHKPLPPGNRIMASNLLKNNNTEAQPEGRWGGGGGRLLCPFLKIE